MKRSSLIICLVLVSLLVAAGIPIAAATPTISDVRPGSGPNTQTLTVTITGTGFSDNSKVWLKKCATGSSDMIDGTITSRSATKLTVDFPLSGHKVGDYDVKVNTPSTMFGGTTDDIGVMAKGFEVYKASGSTTTTTSTGTTTKVTTHATESRGENSVFFETDPSGATIFLDGSEIGTSTFAYSTDMDGSHEVIVKKIGYKDYEETVNIVEGQRTRFYAKLTQLSSSDTTTPVKTVSGQPGKTVTTTRKSTIRIPTPLGTAPPVTEESPADPATVLWAAVLAIAIVVFRRR